MASQAQHVSKIQFLALEHKISNDMQKHFLQPVIFDLHMRDVIMKCKRGCLASLKGLVTSVHTEAASAASRSGIQLPQITS